MISINSMRYYINDVQQNEGWCFCISQLRDNLFQTASPKHGSDGISPVAAYRSEQPGAVCQGCIAPPFIGGLPLTGGPGCFISQRRGGGIFSRAAPLSHDWERAGGLG